MRRIAVGLIGASSALLAGCAFSGPLPSLGFAALALSAYWGFRVLRRPAEAQTGLLAAHAALSCFIAAQTNGWLPTLSLAVALYGWDLANASTYLIPDPIRRIAGDNRGSAGDVLPESDFTRDGSAKAYLTARYTGFALLLAAVGTLLGVAALRLSIPMSFLVALGLSLLAVLIGLAVLRAFQAASNASDRSPFDASEQERAGDASAPPAT